MLQSVVPHSLKEKLQLLNSLTQAFVSDKLEFIPLMLDFKIADMKTGGGESSDLHKIRGLLRAYMVFKESHPAFT